MKLDEDFLNYIIHFRNRPQHSGYRSRDFVYVTVYQNAERMVISSDTGLNQLCF